MQQASAEFLKCIGPLIRAKPVDRMDQQALAYV
jgi:hypothetical protein